MCSVQERKTILKASSPKKNQFFHHLLTLMLIQKEDV